MSNLLATEWKVAPIFKSLSKNQSQLFFERNRHDQATDLDLHDDDHPGQYLYVAGMHFHGH